MARNKQKFYGNQDDLRHFTQLLNSKLRSEERETALHEWQAYKLSKQIAFVKHRLPRRGTRAERKVGIWNKGQYIHALTVPAIDLRGATFVDLCVGYADLRGVLLDDASFTLDRMGWAAMKGVKLERASLKRTQLAGMRLMEADLRRADLTETNLSGADLSQANLAGANLSGANLDGAILEGASLVGATVDSAILDGARVYGVAAWDLKGRPASSKDLVVTPQSATAITADDIRVAQFIYLLINNPEIRDVLDTVTRKVVLLLGRFRPRRKKVLDALRDALRSQDLVPVLFDFDKLSDRDTTETITLLARMARFVIADLTDPASIPHELQAIAPEVEVPIRLIIAKGHRPYSMSRDLGKYPWVIPPFRYRDEAHLLTSLRKEIIDIADAKRIEIERRRTEDGW